MRTFGVFSQPLSTPRRKWSIVLVGPLLPIVDPQPLVRRTQAPVAFERAHPVQVGHHVRNGVRRNGDGLELRRFVLPIRVHQRVRFRHRVRALDAARTGEVSEHAGEEAEIRDPAEHHVLPVHVADAVPGRDRAEMRRLRRGDEPLHHGEPRRSVHGHFTGTPRLSRDPFDDVVTVLSIDAAPGMDIAL